MSLLLAASKAGILDRAAEIIKDIMDQGTHQMDGEIYALRATMCRRMDEVHRNRMARQYGRVRRW